MLCSLNIATFLSRECPINPQAAVWIPKDKLRVEPIRLIWPDGKESITPDLHARSTTASAAYINSYTGLSLSSSEIAELLRRMTLDAEPSKANEDEILVNVPAWRPDILHECDIMEDAAIAYGFNNLKRTFPTTNTVAQQLPVSKLCDVVRREWAYAGWVEVLPLILVSLDWIAVRVRAHGWGGDSARMTKISHG